jgi:hypothetical protein
MTVSAPHDQVGLGGRPSVTDMGVDITPSGARLGALRTRCSPGRTPFSLCPTLRQLLRASDIFIFRLVSGMDKSCGKRSTRLPLAARQRHRRDQPCSNVTLDSIGCTMFSGTSFGMQAINPLHDPLCPLNTGSIIGFPGVAVQDVGQRPELIF